MDYLPTELSGRSEIEQRFYLTFPPVIYEHSFYCISAAAAAKSFQSCPILCDPIDGSPPGSPIPGILQARALEWVAIVYSIVWKWKVKVKWLSGVRLVATPWTAAYQAPPSMGFSRQEYWSGVPSPSPLLHICPNPNVAFLWNLSIFSGFLLVTTLVLIYMSQMSKDVNILNISCVHYYIFFYEVSVQTTYPFYWIFVLLLFSYIYCWSIYSGESPLSDLCTMSIFSHSLVYLFAFLTSFQGVNNFLILSIICWYFMVHSSFCLFESI